MKNTGRLHADQELTDDNDKAQIWDPPKDELERNIEYYDISMCYFGESTKEADIKSLKQSEMQEELNSKFKIIVSHLLNSAGVSSSSKSEHWIEIIARLSLEAAEILNPFISGNSIDPNEYIKVKCIAKGSCNESQVFKGLVFTKHAAHKHMATNYEHPRILLVKGELGEYTSELSSFNIMSNSQERGYKTQARFIEASQPNVILVEKSVSRHLLYHILYRGETLVSDMNLQRLQMISSCFGSPIVPSDLLLSHNLKHCQSFRIENIVEEHNVAGENGKKKSKSLMFLEGYPTSLGITILLKGSDSDNLKRVKKVVKHSVILAYHLILETCFLLDQQAMLSTIISNPQKTSCIMQDSVSDATNSSNGLSSPSLPNDFDRFAAQNQETVPYRTRDLDESIRNSVEERKHQFLFDPRVLLHTNTDDNNLELGLDFPCITVLMSKRNARRGIICDQSQFLNIIFYKDLDVSLEKFLRDLFNQGNRCSACEELPQSHFYCYEHRKVQLRIELKRLLVGKRLPGETKGNIWMWSRCGQKDVTKKVLMSIASRSLSFGKFLDLSFAQQTLLANCGHPLLHFFGLGYMVAMFSYSQVATYTAALPPLKLEVSSSLKPSWLEKEFQNVITKGILMFEEVANFLKKIKCSAPSYHYSFKNLSYIEEILREERLRFEENTKNDFHKATTLGVGFHKLLRLNRVRWEHFLQALVWNYRLHSLVLHDHVLYSSVENEGDEEGHKDVTVNGTENGEKKLSNYGLIQVSNEQENDHRDAHSKDLQILAFNGSYKDQWFWNSFEELRSESIVDIEKEYMLSSKIFGNFFQENLPIVNKIIIEEGSRLHISLRDDYFVVSDYEGELSSLIACALARLTPLGSFDKEQVSKQTFSSEGPKLESVTSPEILVTFGLVDSLGNSKYSVMCLYTNDFRDFRKHCCFSELEYIDSLSRCEQWNAKDGKEQSIFVKTLNDRFILKEIEIIEYESFVKFGPEYFKYMKDSYKLGNQTCLAKVFGIYQVIIRQSNGRRDIRHNLMVMENINFGRNISHEYNLKGPRITRFTTTTSDGAEEVMLGPKFFKDMKNSSVYFSKVSKHTLQSAISNDINFLDSINVMDYSLLVGVDSERHELVCGIVDYLKQFTWDLSYPCRVL